ncbi:MAG: hypothetical protein VX257_02955, partial [Planctomycetota bacterium]|nr:hypothetical protein [Planctomycetota bacterium]
PQKNTTRPTQKRSSSGFLIISLPCTAIVTRKERYEIASLHRPEDVDLAHILTDILENDLHAPGL